MIIMRIHILCAVLANFAHQLLAQKCTTKNGVEKWDWIVVGAGPGGSVAAKYLHQMQPNDNILLLERGRDRNAELDYYPWAQTYIAFSGNFWEEEDYQIYENTHEFGKGWTWPKTLGGAQAANAGAYSLGDSMELSKMFGVDVDSIKSMKAWMTDIMEPHVAVENEADVETARALGVPFRASDTCSMIEVNGLGAGPFIGQCKNPSRGCMMPFRFFDGGKLNGGLMRTSFYKAAFHDQGIGPNKVHKAKGSKGNLLILTGMSAQKLLTDDENDDAKRRRIKGNGLVTGVEVVDNNGDSSTFCLNSDNSKVIVSAGAFETPALLLRSHADWNEDIGKNLYDHAMIAVDMTVQPFLDKMKEIEDTGEIECPLRESYMYWNGEEAETTRTGTSLFEFIYYTDCQNCIAGIFAWILKNGHRGEVTLGDDGKPEISLGYNYPKEDTQPLARAIRKFIDDGDLKWDCGDGPALLESLEKTITTLTSGSDADVTKILSTVWHPGGTCAYGTCINTANGLVKGTRNVYVGDMSAFPEPPTAHTSMMAAMAGAIAVFKATGSKPKLMPWPAGLTCEGKSALMDGAAEMRELCEDKRGRKLKKFQKNCQSEKDENSVYLMPRSYTITGGRLLNNIDNTIVCDNYGMYAAQDICTFVVVGSGKQFKSEKWECECPRTYTASSRFSPGSGGVCPVPKDGGGGGDDGEDCPEVPDITYLSRPEIEAHDDRNLDCWMVVWEKCDSQEALCRSKNKASVEEGCGRDDYWLLDLSHKKWKHPGGKGLISDCGGEAFGWRSLSSGHTDAINKLEAIELQVENTRLYNVFENC